MNSAKNTVVAILLLGVSYGVYQVINAPDGSDPLSGLQHLTGSFSDGDAAKSASTTGAESVEPWNAGSNPVTRPPLPDLVKAPATFNSSATAPANSSEQPVAQFPIPEFKPAPAPAPFETPGNAVSKLSAIPVKPNQSSAFTNPNASSNLAADGTANNGTNRFGTLPTQPVTTNIVPSVPGGGYAGTVPALAPLDGTWPSIEQLVGAGDYRAALQKLTPYHERIDANNPQRVQLTEWLDALAAKVVYSTEHHLAKTPYIVQPGDSLDSIAQSWNVPTQLVYNINRDKIPDPMSLGSGIELKKIEGPFKAVVSPSRTELTLYCDGLYAGRFPIVSARTGMVPGTMHVARKQGVGHQCGDYCIELDQPGLVIHASDGMNNANPAGIGFRTSDAEDLFGILSEGSEVIVR